MNHSCNLPSQSPARAATAHVYVHVPFCDGKCPYCAFYSERVGAGQPARFLEALAAEMDRWRQPANDSPTQTLYVGGGTPTVLDPPRLSALLTLLQTRLDLTRLREWTVEANPGTLTRQKARILADAGVTRVSIGAQALTPASLAALGRRHTAGQIGEAVALCREAGIPFVGLDLIASVPGTAPADWRRTLEAATALGPDHVSVYSLTIHPGTAFAKAVRGKTLQVADDARQIADLGTARRILLAAGYEHYEISNYARPGCACRHNEACWLGEDYVGFGPAAASRCGLRRWRNRPNLDAYCRSLLQGRTPPRAAERLPAADDVAERFLFGFRLLRGVDLAAFCERFSPAAQGLRPRWEAALSELRGHGLVANRGARWRLTARGRLVADSVAEALA